MKHLLFQVYVNCSVKNLKYQQEIQQSENILNLFSIIRDP